MFLYFRDDLVVRWREFSNPDVYRTAVHMIDAHDRSARRRDGARPHHRDRRPGRRHAARRPRRAGHEDRTARAAIRRARSAVRRCGTAGSAARCFDPDDADGSRARRRTRVARRRARRELRTRHRRALGIDHDTLLARNPRLVYCSITAYGDDGAHADRPAVDALVAARTGHQWESRGVPGGTLARLAGSRRVPRPRRARRLLGRRAAPRPAVLAACRG